MNITNLKRQLFFKYALNKYEDHFSEMESNILIAIHLMNSHSERCSSNTLILFLKKIKHTPRKQNLLKVIRKFKQKELVRGYGKRNGTNILLTIEGNKYLHGLEHQLRRARPIQ